MGRYLFPINILIFFFARQSSNMSEKEKINKNFLVKQYASAAILCLLHQIKISLLNSTHLFLFCIGCRNHCIKNLCAHWVKTFGRKQKILICSLPVQCALC